MLIEMTEGTRAAGSQPDKKTDLAARLQRFLVPRRECSKYSFLVASLAYEGGRVV